MCVLYVFKGNESLPEPLGRVWCIGRVDAFRPKGHGFDSRSSRHLGTLGKYFIHSCLWRFGVKFGTVSTVHASRGTGGKLVGGASWKLRYKIITRGRKAV